MAIAAVHLPLTGRPSHVRAIVRRLSPAVNGSDPRRFPITFSFRNTCGLGVYRLPSIGVPLSPPKLIQRQNFRPETTNTSAHKKGF